MAYDFSDNIQRGILYLLKSDKDFYLQIVNLVKDEYFEFPSHTKIYNVVRDYYEKYGKLPNDDFILQDLKAKKTVREDLSDYEDELQLINSVDKSCLANDNYLLDIVEGFAKKESMKAAIAESIQLIKEDRTEEVEAIVKEAMLVNRDVDTGQDYFSEVGGRWERVFNAPEKTTFTGVLPSIDKSLEGGGLSTKELAMVVAPPGVGKSLWLVNQGVQTLIEGKKVLYISLEMGEDKIAQRFDSVMTLIPQCKLRDPSNQLTVKERLELFQKEFPGSQLKIKEYPSTRASSNTIRSLLVQLKNFDEFEPNLLIVDYLELLHPVRDIQAEHQAQQRISEELRGLGQEFDMLVWTATQTNRQGKLVKVITDAELADSYGKIRTCDLSISLNQTDEEFDNGRMRAFVMKSRNGRPRFLTPVNVDYNTLRMTEGVKEEDDYDE